MIAIGGSDELAPTDAVRTDDAGGSDDELERLRARERELQTAYLRDPWNMATQGALVRAQQDIRRREESAGRLADNAPAKPPALDAAEHARHGSPIRLVESPPASPDASDFTTPVSQFTDAEQVRQQIQRAEVAVMMGAPHLYFRLVELRARLVVLQAHESATRVTPPAAPPPTALGHGDCTPPRPQALPGNAHRVADAGINLETSLSNAYLNTAELERYIDEYTAYTATKPELRALHDDAVARGPQILAARFDADDEARELESMRPLVERQAALVQVRPPIGVQQHVLIGGIALRIAEAARLVIAFAPGEGQIIDLALTAIEAATGRSLGGLGPPVDTSAAERALGVMFALAPYADKLLSVGVASAAGIVRLAKAAGRTEAEIRALLSAARETAKDRAAIQEGFALARAGRALTPRSAQAMYRARQRATQLGAVMLGGPSAGVVRAQQANNARHVEKYIGRAASPSAPPPGYIVYAERSGQLRIRRVVPEDSLVAPLTVDAKGRIRWGSAERLSKRGELAKALGTPPTNHQAHHVVPDAVVRDSPLFQEARKRGVPPYNVDGPTNGAYLPVDAASRTAATKGLPVHSGSHPVYSALGARIAMEQEEHLVRRYGSLAQVPANELAKATRRVEDEMRKNLEQWKAKQGDVLR